MENIGLFDLDFSSDFYIEKMEKFLISRSFLEAIGWMTIARYAAVLILEFEICILLFNGKIALRVFLTISGLILLGIFIQSPVWYGIWTCLAILATGILAHTQLGAATNALVKSKADLILRNWLAWAFLFALTYTLWIGTVITLAATREPHTAQEKITYLFHEKNGSIQIVFKKGNESFSTNISKDDPSPFSEGDCLELTYYEPSLASVELFHVLQKYVTQIQSGNQCP